MRPQDIADRLSADDAAELIRLLKRKGDIEETLTVTDIPALWDQINNRLQVLLPAEVSHAEILYPEDFSMFSIPAELAIETSGQVVGENFRSRLEAWSEVSLYNAFGELGVSVKVYMQVDDQEKTLTFDFFTFGDFVTADHKVFDFDAISQEKEN